VKQLSDHNFMRSGDVRLRILLHPMKVKLLEVKMKWLTMSVLDWRESISYWRSRVLRSCLIICEILFNS